MRISLKQNFSSIKFLIKKKIIFSFFFFRTLALRDYNKSLKNVLVSAKVERKMSWKMSVKHISNKTSYKNLRPVEGQCFLILYINVLFFQRLLISIVRSITGSIRHCLDLLLRSYCVFPSTSFILPCLIGTQYFCS